MKVEERNKEGKAFPLSCPAASVSNCGIFLIRKQMIFAIMSTQIFVLTVKIIIAFCEGVAWFCLGFSSEMEDFRTDP